MLRLSHYDSCQDSLYYADTFHVVCCNKLFYVEYSTFLVELVKGYQTIRHSFTIIMKFIVYHTPFSSFPAGI